MSPRTAAWRQEVEPVEVAPRAWREACARELERGGRFCGAHAGGPDWARGWSALAEAGAGGPFAPVWRVPHLRRETAAHVTDAMRALLVRAAGYEVSPMEFVPVEHTVKNTLLVALRRGAPDPAAAAEYAALVAATGGVGLALAERLSQARDALT